jgi:hypothetical protein
MARDFYLMQGINRSTHLIRSWSSIQQAGDRKLSMEVSTQLEDIVRDNFIPLDVSVIYRSGLW